MKQLMAFLSLLARTFAYLVIFGAPTLQAATVWSGYDHAFSKADNVDPFSSTGQDEITASVVITRGNFGGGLLNATSDSFFNSETSPSGTLWAFPFNNPSGLIAASNWQNLDFHPWSIAFGRNGNGGPPAQIGVPSVLYSVADDLYLDVMLTGWTIRAGGGFSYVRATRPPTGDFDDDSDVDGRDFLEWQRGESTNPFNTTDLELWQQQYGNGALTPFSSIPEPYTLNTAFALFSAVACSLRRF